MNPTPAHASKSIWQSWSVTTRFSILAFCGSMALSLLSMGALGYLLYYPVAPLLPESIDTLPGDTTWPSVIFAGMVWSFGFLLAGIAFHYSNRQNLQKVIMYVI